MYIDERCVIIKVMKLQKGKTMEQPNSFLLLFLAPVKDFLEDDNVSEILINGPEQIYIEKNGK